LEVDALNALADGAREVAQRLGQHLATGVSSEPWLFFREGRDWKTWSWERCGAELERFRIPAMQPSFADALVGMSADGTPREVLLGLALAAGGAEPRAFENEEQARRAGAAYWLETSSCTLRALDSLPNGALGSALDGALDEPLEIVEDALGARRASPRGNAGEGLEATRRLDARRRSTALLRELLDQATPRTSWRRHVVVEGAPFATLLSRYGLEWALERRCAVVLAPSARSWVEVVSWARPTVLWGSGAAIDALWRSLEGRSRRRRKRLDRLSVVLWSAQDEPDAESVEGLRRLGVEAQAIETG
jgi:hypothetical protein